MLVCVLLCLRMNRYKRQAFRRASWTDLLPIPMYHHYPLQVPSRFLFFRYNRGTVSTQPLWLQRARPPYQGHPYGRHFPPCGLPSLRPNGLAEGRAQGGQTTSRYQEGRPSRGRQAPGKTIASIDICVSLFLYPLAELCKRLSVTHLNGRVYEPPLLRLLRR